MLRYYSEQEAESEFKKELTGWLSYGYRGCYSAIKTSRAVHDAFNWAIGSRTASDLFLKVKNSTRQIAVVGMRGGFQCFGNAEGRNKIPVIFIDLDASLTTNVRDAHSLEFEPQAWTQGHAYATVKGQQKKVILKTAPLNNNIAIIHEFGHAWQWIERPLLFGNPDGKGTANKGIKTGSFDFNARHNKDVFAKEILNKATAMHNATNQRKTAGGNAAADDGFLRTQNELDSWKPPAWSVPIEQDNMSRHEWPVCKELRLPVRQNYRDINGFSSGKSSTTSILGQSAKEEAEKQAQALAKRAAEVNASAVGSAVCPQCNSIFPSATKLGIHMRNTGHQAPAEED